MPDQTLQEIKDRLNIADIIAGYIPIKKAGVNFKTPCPFHHEKTPSLIISPQKQIWHCFGCGEGGDVFGFVMKYENLEFREALKLLADKAGVKLPQYKPQDKGVEDEKELLLRINDFAARFYHQVLTSRAGMAAFQYLKNRGLLEQTIKQWQIGYAPDDFHALERALSTKKVSSADLIKAGVCSKNERGQIYDRFRGRITFPIYNYFGDTVGFSARLLADNPNAAKYVNSPETIIYNKSRTLFGMNFAKEAIRKKDEMVVVEGQMDCISLHQAGFNNVIASSGTAYNSQALDFTAARRLTKNIKFCFDADSAGQTATRRAGEQALRQGFKVKLIILKNVKDPDELVKKSPGLWEKAVSEAVWFLDYYINAAETGFPSGSVEQNLYLSQQVVPLLNFIGDTLEQDHYIHKIITKFSIFERTIRDELKKQNVQSFPKIQNTSSGAVVGSLLLQKEVLGGLLFLENFSLTTPQKIEKQDFQDPAIAQLVELWLNTGGQAEELKQSALAKEALFMVESQLDELGGDKVKLKNSLQKSFILLKLRALKAKQQALQAEIMLAETQGSKEKLQEFNKEFAQVASLRAELEKIANI